MTPATAPEIKTTGTNPNPGQTALAQGEKVAMRFWNETPGDKQGESLHSHDYEVVGYVVSGKARLHLGDQTVELKQGDSWLVPAGAEHRYEIVEAFQAVEATSAA